MAGRPGKINKEQAKEMRELYDSGLFTKALLAQKYGVAKTTIFRYLNPGFYERHLIQTKKWAQNHPDKVREIRNRASLKFYYNHREEIIARFRKRSRTPEFRAWSRARYHRLKAQKNGQ